MRHTEIELAALSGGSANGYKGKFQLQLETGVRYKEIHVLTKNLEENQIKEIRITKDGDSIIEMGGWFFHALQKYKREHHDANVLIIPFADFAQMTQKAQNLSGLDTLPTENWVLHIETAEATAAQTTANSVAEISLEAIMSPLPAWGRLYLPRIYEDTIVANRTGEVRFKQFTEQNKSGMPTAIRRAHLLGEHVTEFKVLQDEKVIFEKTAEKNVYDLKRSDLEPQQFTNNANALEAIYHFDPTKTAFGFVDKFNTDEGKFEARMKLNAPKSIPVIYEVVELVGTKEQIEQAAAAGYGQVW